MRVYVLSMVLYVDVRFSRKNIRKQIANHMENLCITQPHPKCVNYIYKYFAESKAKPNEESN